MADFCARFLFDSSKVGLIVSALRSQLMRKLPENAYYAQIHNDLDIRAHEAQEKNKKKKKHRRT